MRLITEYISISSINEDVKLSYTPVYSAEMGRYALLEDSFKLIAPDGSIIPMWGEIKELNGTFFLVFDNIGLVEGQYKVILTYAIESQYLLSDFFQTAPLLNKYNDFALTPVAKVPMQNGYILQRAEYLATQYKESHRLKAILLASLQQLEECFVAGEKIPYIFDLDTANGIYLDFLGRIVGVGRKYCGNFFENLSFSLNVYHQNFKNISEIELDDRCMRELIRIKIEQNNKKVVNYKTLQKLISVFLGKDIGLEDYGKFEIGVDVGEIDENEIKCLILLRAFVPLPPTIKMNFIESMLGDREDSMIVATDGLCEAIGVVKAPDIVIQSIEDTALATDSNTEVEGVIQAPDIVIQSKNNIMIACLFEQEAIVKIEEE